MHKPCTIVHQRYIINEEIIVENDELASVETSCFIGADLKDVCIFASLRALT